MRQIVLSKSVFKVVSRALRDGVEIVNRLLDPSVHGDRLYRLHQKQKDRDSGLFVFLLQ